MRGSMKRAPAEKLLNAGVTRCFLERYSVVDVAYNPAVLQRGEENGAELDQLIRLTLKFIEERYSLTLSYAYHIAPFKLKGSLQRMRESLRRGQTPGPCPQEQARSGE